MAKVIVHLRNTCKGLALIGLMGLSACSARKTVFEKEIKLKDALWTDMDTLRFDFEVIDTSRTYNLYLDVEHSASFAYQNLYVQIRSYAPEQAVIEEQHSLELQEKNGEWIGSCKRNTCNLRFVLREGLQFASTGDYRIDIGQYSRKDSLSGIQAIGILLETNQD